MTFTKTGPDGYTARVKKKSVRLSCRGPLANYPVENDQSDKFFFRINETNRSRLAIEKSMTILFLPLSRFIVPA